MAEPNGQNGNERLDRMERILEALAEEHVAFASEHKQLLRAQVILTDRMDKLAQAQALTEQRFRDTDERIGILIKMMDEWIRRHPEPPQPS